MAFHRRHLPHWIPDGATIFVAWRLAGCVPSNVEFAATGYKRAAVFFAGDERVEDRRQKTIVCPTVARREHAWLLDPRVARVIVDALRYGESVRGFYKLHAWVIMPNHVHVIFQPHCEMPEIMRWLKGRTARQANRILGLTGTAFWQNDSFDHWIRSEDELRHLIFYVENNPVKAGLVAEPSQWLWSSGG